MAMLTDRNYTHRNETADINCLIPVMSRDIAVRDIEVKVENDLSLNQGVIKTEDTIGYDMDNRQNLPLYVAVDEIKVEYDEAVNQDITDQENISSVFHDIKVETEDHDVECGSTTTKDFVTNDIKIEIIQEMITTEEFTNIEMLGRSTLPTDAAVNSVKVEDCGVMNQDGANESATNSDVKHGDVLLDKDYSPDNSLPSAETIHKVELCDTGVQQVTKVPDDSPQVKVTRRQLAADCRLTVDDKLPLANQNNTELTHTTVHENHLQNQFEVRSGKVSHLCQVCHKIFGKKSTLTRHMTIHSGEKPYSCDICHQLFTRKYHLIPHMRIHLGVKPLSCEICNKTYSHSGTLACHMKTHLEQNPYSCKICHKTFSHPGSLSYHMGVHLEERPFSCEICPKTFNFKNNLKSHMQRIHSGKEPLSCHICNKKYIRPSQLTAHVKRHSVVTMEVRSTTYNRNELLS